MLGGRLGGCLGGARETVFQRQQDELADRGRDQQEEEGKASQDQPATITTPAPDQRKPDGAKQQREVTRPRREPDNLRNDVGKIGHEVAQVARAEAKQRCASLSSETATGYVPTPLRRLLATVFGLRRFIHPLFCCQDGIPQFPHEGIALRRALNQDRAAI